jgi:hypothetical protein
MADLALDVYVLAVGVALDVLKIEFRKRRLLL